ncbi:hypothetical protein [Kaistia terrae]|uniref:Transposase n=1 Tax=Kaistia terrae TaxID=537017 RepID=A0ABW0PZV8_9HYPH|nr:hypothetical protein [Kaistia terrae]MCX5580494.1 hypothetical protein [Kaistia terrae]
MRELTDQEWQTLTDVANPQECVLREKVEQTSDAWMLATSEGRGPNGSERCSVTVGAVD